MSTRPPKKKTHSAATRARTHRSRVPDPAEVLPTLDDPTPTAIRSYERTFEEVLRSEVDKVRDPVLAFSRAAQATWDVSFLPPHHAEAARLRVLDRSGLPRLRGCGTQAELDQARSAVLPEIPRPRAVKGERVRRGGTRR